MVDISIVIQTKVAKLVYYALGSLIFPALWPLAEEFFYFYNILKKVEFQK